jgi:hypothetical protein
VQDVEPDCVGLRPATGAGHVGHARTLGAPRARLNAKALSSERAGVSRAGMRLRPARGKRSRRARRPARQPRRPAPRPEPGGRRHARRRRHPSSQLRLRRPRACGSRCGSRRVVQDPAAEGTPRLQPLHLRRAPSVHAWPEDRGRASLTFLPQRSRVAPPAPRHEGETRRSRKRPASAGERSRLCGGFWFSSLWL